MIKHNLFLLYRTFVRFKMTFLINLIGLSVGLVCVGLIYLWVNDELQVDNYHEKGERLYQVLQNSNGEQIQTDEFTPGPLAKTLEDEMPEVEYATTVVPAAWFPYKGIISVGDTRMKAECEYASNHFFDVFTCPLIRGDKAHALVDKNSIVLTEDMAMRLFHTIDNVVGKSVDWKHEPFVGTFYVTAICETPPLNASNRFDILLNFEYFVEQRPWTKEWGNSDPHTFVALKPGVNVAAFNTKIVNLKRAKTNNPEEGTLFIQRYRDKYLHGRYENGVPAGGRIEYVQMFSIIAVFILLIACINFMNLSTAKATRRIREVGIKKAIGAGRRTLIAQYLGESLTMTLLALIIAVLAIDLMLPVFNTLTGKYLVLHFDMTLLAWMTVILIVTGLLAGSYPALYLSGFSPASVLKGKLAISWGEVWARRGLVIFQFTLSVLLIISVIVVYKQMNYIQSRSQGFSRDQVLYFEMEMPRDWNLDPFLTEVRNIPGVVNAACFYHDLMGQHGGTSDVQWEGKSADNRMGFANLDVGVGFIETMGIAMAEGKPFSRDVPAERQIVFNESAIREMGIQDPVGKTVKLWGEEKQIMGVTKDFHFESFYKKVGPCFIQAHAGLPNIMVKIAAGNEEKTIDQLRQVYAVYSPGITFDFKFVDERYHALYASEFRISVLSRYFAAIAILISCLGLFGLAAFTAERRTKEIGIRKILGSSNTSIIMLLSGDFTRMVLIAILIASPVSYFVTRNWLDHFVYRTEIELWYFAAAGVLALIIAWGTVGVQTFKAARVNPVNSLKEQ